MKFVTVRDLRTRPAQVWKALREVGDLVVTSNGKPIAVLSPTSEASLEQSLAALRRARALGAVERLQGSVPGSRRPSADEIEAEIREVRRLRKAGR
jgi:prevent-host-death family protein